MIGRKIGEFRDERRVTPVVQGFLLSAHDGGKVAADEGSGVKAEAGKGLTVIEALNIGLQRDVLAVL